MTRREKIASLIQGEMDGLCGVYAATHSLLHFRGINSQRLRARYFNAILSGLFEQDRFSPSKIRGGFNRKAIEASLSLLIERDSQLQIEVMALPKFAKLVGAKTVIGCLERLKIDESVLLFAYAPSHWISAYRKRNGIFECYDSSSDANNRMTVLSEAILERRSVRMASGLAILRQS